MKSQAIASMDEGSARRQISTSSAGGLDEMSVPWTTDDPYREMQQREIENEGPVHGVRNKGAGGLTCDTDLKEISRRR